MGDRRLVGQRDVKASGHSGRGNLFEPAQGAAREPHGRLSRRQIDHPEVAPEDTGAKAGAEGFRTGLLGSEPAGVARRPIGPPVAVPALGIGKDAVEKAVAKTFDCLLDAADIDQIAAETKDQRGPLPRPGRRRSKTDTPIRAECRWAAAISRALARPS